MQSSRKVRRRHQGKAAEGEERDATPIYFETSR
jgi:hypothetical protein